MPRLIQNTPPLVGHTFGGPGTSSSSRPPTIDPRSNRLDPEILLGCIEQVATLFLEQHPGQAALLVTQLESLLKQAKTRPARLTASVHYLTLCE
jgi:hypothetical protein